jgi:hypothetical protein
MGGWEDGRRGCSPGLRAATFAFYSLSEIFPLGKQEFQIEPSGETLYVGVIRLGSARG